MITRRVGDAACNFYMSTDTSFRVGRTNGAVDTSTLSRLWSQLSEPPDIG